MDELTEVKNMLTLEDIFNLLYALGADPERGEGMIISRTLCHGGQSHKLFYYENTKLFRCYTECSDTFDVFQLIMKINHQEEMTLPQAIKYIKQFFNIEIFNNNYLEDKEVLEDWNILNNYINQEEDNSNNKRVVEMKFYEKEFLNNFPQPHILNWEKEGINYNTIQKRNIRYNPVSQAIIIPHYDKDNNLVGVRERTLIKENEINGKYRPMYINRKMYNHPLGFNLFNLNNSKDNIQKMRLPV